MYSSACDLSAALSRVAAASVMPFTAAALSSEAEKPCTATAPVQFGCYLLLCTLSSKVAFGVLIRFHLTFASVTLSLQNSDLFLGEKNQILKQTCQILSVWAGWFGAGFALVWCSLGSCSPFALIESVNQQRMELLRTMLGGDSRELYKGRPDCSGQASVSLLVLAHTHTPLRMHRETRRVQSHCQPPAAP